MSSVWFLAGLLLFLGNILLTHQTAKETPLRVLYKWKAPDFLYPYEGVKDELIKRGLLVPKNVAIIDADYYAPTQRLFVSSPQFQKGIPVSLSEVVGEEGILKPFPSWPSYVNDSVSCDFPFSVYRFTIDKCGLLWAIDAGRTRTGLACPPKLLVYDLADNDRQVLRHDFPKGVYTDRGSFITIITESYESDCSDTIAYIADSNDHALIMFDMATKTSWRIEHIFFYPFPTEYLATLNGVTFSVMAGIAGVALGPPTQPNRKLYFHSVASVRESWVPVSVLKNQSFTKHPVIAGSVFSLSPGKRAGHSTVQVMTDDGILIYALVTMNAIACWNIEDEFTIENQYTLLRDDENFQFITGMKLKDNNLWIVSSKFHIYGRPDIIPNEKDYKYRVMVIEDVKRLLHNTPCSSGSRAQKDDGYEYNSAASAGDSSSHDENEPIKVGHGGSPKKGYLRGGFGGGAKSEPSERSNSNNVYNAGSAAQLSNSGYSQSGYDEQANGEYNDGYAVNSLSAGYDLPSSYQNAFSSDVFGARYSTASPNAGYSGDAYSRSRQPAARGGSSRASSSESTYGQYTSGFQSSTASDGSQALYSSNQRYGASQGGGGGGGDSSFGF